MVRGKLKPGLGVPPAPPPPMAPWSKSDQRFQTACDVKFPNSLFTTAAVQLLELLQYPVPASAVSKNGCGAIVGIAEKPFSTLYAVVLQATIEVAQPNAVSTAAYADANVWP